MIPVILVMGATMIVLVLTIVWAAVYLVRAISQALSTTFATSHQTVTSPGEATQATPTWQELSTVPWENWEREGLVQDREPEP